MLGRCLGYEFSNFFLRLVGLVTMHIYGGEKNGVGEKLSGLLVF